MCFPKRFLSSAEFQIIEIQKHIPRHFALSHIHHTWMCLCGRVSSAQHGMRKVSYSRVENMWQWEPSFLRVPGPFAPPPRPMGQLCCRAPGSHISNSFGPCWASIQHFPYDLWGLTFTTFPPLRPSNCNCGVCDLGVSTFPKLTFSTFRFCDVADSTLEADNFATFRFYDRL